MSLFRSLNEDFPLERQLEVDAAPVVLANVFTMEAADEHGFLHAWKHDIAFIKMQPGFISAQLHRGVGDHPTYLVYAVWESVSAFRAAFVHPDFIAKLSGFPPSVVSRPYLFQKVAIPGVCTK